MQAKWIKWTCVGFLAGLAWLYGFSLLQQNLRPAWLAHAVVIGVVLAALAVAALMLRSKTSLAVAACCVGAAVALALGIAASINSSVTVARRAKDTAGDKPFCIQVADRGDYQRARTLLDLSGLTMWADGTGSMRVQHHAILIVGDDTDRRLFHWSYRRREFVPGVINATVPGFGPALFCDPKHNFTEQLSLIFPQSSDGTFVRFSKQQAYRIPNTYQPIARGSHNAHLILATTAPDFGPLKAVWKDLPPAEKDRNWAFIELNTRDLKSFAHTSMNERSAEQASEYGLQKRLVTGQFRSGQKYRRFQYWKQTSAEADSPMQTWIDCSPASGIFPASCQHRFLDAGRHLYFRHRPEDVPRWQEMQQKLVDLLASFAVANEDAPPR